MLEKSGRAHPGWTADWNDRWGHTDGPGNASNTTNGKLVTLGAHHLNMRKTFTCPTSKTEDA